MTKIRDELHNKGGVKSVWVLEKECTGWDFKIIQKWSYKVTEPKWCVFVEIVEEIASNSKVSHSRKTDVAQKKHCVSVQNIVPNCD